MKLKLHEAIVVVLLKKENRMASLNVITDEINERGLYFQKDGSPTHAGQIRMRTYPTTKTGKQHTDLFEFIKPDKVKLKNL